MTRPDDPGDEENPTERACDNRAMELRAGNSKVLLIAPALLLFGLAILIHLDALHGWWLSDDPQVLVQAMRYSPVSILFDPPSWRYLSSSSFTPLVTLSFALDLALAGLHPAFFYAHQLLMIGLATVLFFLLLAKGGRVLSAFLGTATFVVLPATFAAAGSLMIRHYLEGLVLSLLALLLWIPVRKDDGRSAWRTIFPAVLYLLAMLAKEFYAPLPLLMIWIDHAAGVSPRRTAVRILPSAASALVYLVWRTFMLGSGGGYGTTITTADLLALPRVLWSAIAGPMPPIAKVTILLAMTALLLFAAIRKPAAAGLLLLLGGTFALIPLVILSSSFEGRYAFVSSVLLVAVVTLAAGSSGRWTTPVLALILVVVSFAGWSQRGMQKFESRAIIAEGQYIWRKPAQAPTILASAPGWYLEGLSWIRAKKGHGASPPFVLSPDAFLFTALSPANVVTAEWGSGRIVRLSPPVQDEIARTRARYVSGAPLSIDISRRGNDLSWRLGPPDGSFTFLTHPSYSRFAMPSAGFRRIPQAGEQQYFRIRRDDPDGSWTASPPLPLPKSDGSLRWSR